MCAIFGLLDYKGKLTTGQRLRIIKVLGTVAEIRGTDATGIAFFQRDRLRIQKAPTPAHKMKYRIPAEVRVIMGHTRMTTQGCACKNQNNHPFAGRAGNTAFALAHNGVLYNDLDLRQRKGLPITDIETDSYIAVQLIEQQKELTFHSLRQMAEAVEGSFVFTLLDQNNCLYFVKGDNPLTIYHYPKLGLYLYASTEEILQSALKNLRMERLRPEIIRPDLGEILMIDRYGRQSSAEFTMKVPLTAWTDPWKSDFQQQYILDLKSVARCFGYAPEEIDLLLSNGFAAEDIEEMLYCYDSSNF